MSEFERCFERMPFPVMNSIDINMLIAALFYSFKKFPVRSQQIFFDVGANAGSFVKALLYLESITNIQTRNIHCFEPHPVVSKYTKAAYPYITMNEYCLGSSEGRLDLHIPVVSCELASNTNLPSFAQLDHPVSVLNVECKTLDGYCAQNNIEMIDFIKIDVEGSEKSVFDGATRMLKEKRIRCGLFDVGIVVDASEEDMIQLLEGYGYKVDRAFDKKNYIFYLDR